MMGVQLGQGQGQRGQPARLCDSGPPDRDRVRARKTSYLGQAWLRKWALWLCPGKWASEQEGHLWAQQGDPGEAEGGTCGLATPPNEETPSIWKRKVPAGQLLLLPREP